MRRTNLLFLIISCFIVSEISAQPQFFSSSLHKNRSGKPYWYNTVQNGGTGGFEILTGVPMTHPNMGCVQCHGSNDANGNPYSTYDPSCSDCHKTDMTVDQNQCFTCHSRQGAEITVHLYSDVHRTADMKCWACHKSQDMHGDGTTYNSMLEPGAVKAACEDCHIAGTTTLPSHASWDPHNGKLDCDACHAQAVISCYNCHFESQVEHHLKRPKQQIKDFVILGNITKKGKVGVLSFQSLSYQGHTWVAMAPYHPHNIKKEGRVCTDCHANFGGQIDAISDYNADGIMQFAKWNSSDSTLTWLKKIVPLPMDYKRSFKMDFITFNGDPGSPVVASKNWSFVKGEADGFQLMYATPLSVEQMQKLGFNTTWVSVEEKTNEIPNGFSLEQNYPNPFNPSTTIKYSIPEVSFVSLKVYDAIGNLVETILEKEQNSGVYTVQFDGTKLASGIYYYQIKTPKFTQTKKLMLLK